jgi:preprotein translocase subunit YajC
MNWTNFAWQFAVEEKPANDPTGGLGMLLPMMAIAILFYFLLIRPQKREQAKREAMLSTMKKNDRVVTIGGMLGVIANISPDGQEVTLKVDDNTRIRMVRSSIQRIVSEDSPGETPADSKT